MNLPRMACAAGLLIAALAASGCTMGAGATGADIGDLLPSQAQEWSVPLRLTRGPGAQFSADFHAGRRVLAYVWDREGNADIYLQEDVPTSLRLPRRLAAHTARDRGPRLSPDGKRLLFVSTRRDSGGDVWMLRLKGWSFRAALRRLTDEATCDDQPCWHPDGRTVLYASSPSLGGQYDLWRKRPGREPDQLTRRGGQMPDCSPDGQYVVFVSTRRAGVPDLWLLRLSDLTCVALTSGPELDVHPCWSADGSRVYFVRYELDTNGDGRLDRADASSVYSVAFEPGIFSTGGRPPVRQLTALSSSEAFVRALDGGFLYTAMLGGDRADVFALGPTGLMPVLSGATELLEFAQRMEADEETDPHMRLMAWQNVRWAFRTARSRGEAMSAEVAGRASAAWLRAGRILRDLGYADAARRAYESLLAEVPGARVAVGRARVELLALERLEGAGQSRLMRPAATRWAGHLARAAALEREFAADARKAEHAGDAAGAKALRAVCALARLETGLTYLDRREYARAIGSLQAVRETYPEQREAGARALLASARVYALLDEPDALLDSYLRVLKEYGDQREHAARAAGMAVDALVDSATSREERLVGLRRIVEDYADVPVLSALAQNRIGDLFYAEKDYLRAVQEYGRTIDRFAEERDQLAAAYLAIGRIRTEQQDYDRAVASFQAMGSVFDGRGRRYYARARRGYVNSLLLKAGQEMQLGDVALALTTYSALAEFDPALPAAHRGIVEAYARLGRVGEVVGRYRSRANNDPRDHLAHYALALAYSYLGPTEWMDSRRATARRVKADREALRLVGQAVLAASEVPYYHQLRGFLLNRLAVATGESDYKVRALDAYMAALGTSDPMRDAANYPNALFNVGEGCMLVGQPQVAYGYYRHAVEAGFPLTGLRGHAALIKISTSAMAAQDYDYAVLMLERALDILREQAEGGADAARHVQRVAETLDRLALAHHLGADYLAAVQTYRRYIGAVERLMAERPDAEDAYGRNLLRANRNLAVNLYMAVQQGAASPEQLAESYALLQDAVARLDRVGVVEREQEGGPGLVTIDIQVALGERSGPAVFDEAAERRLLYTYMARISAAVGNYRHAVDYLQRKAALYPRLAADTERSDLLTEQAVVWTQIGEYRVTLGELTEAAQAYRRAVELEGRADNLPGEAQAAASLGRVALQLAGREDTPPGLSELVAFAVRTHEDLLRRLERQDADYLVPALAELQANLSLLRELQTAKGGVK